MSLSDGTKSMDDLWLKISIWGHKNIKIARSDQTHSDFDKSWKDNVGSPVLEECNHRVIFFLASCQIERALCLKCACLHPPTFCCSSNMTVKGLTVRKWVMYLMPNTGLFPKSRCKANTGLSHSLCSLMAKFPLFVLPLGETMQLRLNSPKIPESTKRTCEAFV